MNGPISPRSSSGLPLCVSGRDAMSKGKRDPSKGSPSLSALAKKSAFLVNSETNLVKLIYRHSTASDEGVVSRWSALYIFKLRSLT